jgi:hypothetical protein
MSESHLCRLCSKPVPVSQAFARSIQRTGGPSIACSSCWSSKKSELFSAQAVVEEPAFVFNAISIVVVLILAFIATSAFSAWHILERLETWTEPGLPSSVDR